MHLGLHIIATLVLVSSVANAAPARQFAQAKPSPAPAQPTGEEDPVPLSIDENETTGEFQPSDDSRDVFEQLPPEEDLEADLPPIPEEEPIPIEEPRAVVKKKKNPNAEVPFETLRESVRDEVAIVEVSPYTQGPYRDRRPAWGSMVSISRSSYNPKDYPPDFAPGRQFITNYDAAETPLTEILFSLRRQFSWASIGLELGAGTYKNSGQDDSLITITPILAGGNFSLDALFPEPYLVPYVRGGTYKMLYRESAGVQAVNGTTDFGLYYGAGLKVQLDWIDDHGDHSGYNEHGLENSFFFAEVRQFLLISTKAGERYDLSTPDSEPIQLTLGLALEF